MRIALPVRSRRVAALAAAVALAIAVPALCAAQSSSVSTGTVTVPAGVVHQGPIKVSLGAVVVRGTEIGNVAVSVGEVEVSGHVTGSIQVGLGEIILAHGALVGGSIQVGAGRQERLGPGQPLPAINAPASVGAPFPPRATRVVGTGWPLPLGSLVGGLSALSLAWPLGGVGIVLALFGRLGWWLLSLAVAFALLSLFPVPTRRVADEIERAPGPNLGWGLLVALASGPASVLIAITILGIPLSMLLGLALLAAKVMGYVAVSLLLGARLLPRLGATRPAIGWELVAGTVLLLLIGSIPVLGFFLDVGVTLLGIGACGRTGFGTGRPWFRAPALPPSPPPTAPA